MAGGDRGHETHLLAVLGLLVVAELDHRDPGLFVRVVGVPAVLVLVGPLVSCRADGGQIIGAEVTSAVQPALATTHTTGVLYNKGRPTLTSPQTTTQTQTCFGGNIQTNKSSGGVTHKHTTHHPPGKCGVGGGSSKRTTLAVFMGCRLSEKPNFSYNFSEGD